MSKSIATGEGRVIAPTEATSSDDFYLIWSNEHGLWWRPNACGYTISVEEAGRYTKEEALKHCTGRDQRPDKPLPELPVRVGDLLSVLSI